MYAQTLHALETDSSVAFPDQQSHHSTRIARRAKRRLYNIFTIDTSEEDKWFIYLAELHLHQQME